MEEVGGNVLRSEEPVAMSDGSLAALMAYLDQPEPASVAARAEGLDEATRSLLPGPLRRYVDRSLSELPWRRVGRLFEEYRLPLAGAGVKAALLRLPPGSLMPRHSHRGQEFTLVLAGGYRDGDVAYGPGDFSAKDPTDQHQPVVDEDGPCICLVALDAPLRLSGAVGVLVNPFLRI
jgi:putative transcriptional regulator